MFPLKDSRKEHCRCVSEMRPLFSEVLARHMLLKSRPIVGAAHPQLCVNFLVLSREALEHWTCVPP